MHFACCFHPSSPRGCERVRIIRNPGLIIARADPHSSLRSTFQESQIRERSLPKGFGTVSFHRLYNNEASYCAFLITINARGKYLCYSPFFFRGCISLDLLGGFLILVDRFSFERTKIVDNGIFYSKDKGYTVFVRISTSVREIIRANKIGMCGKFCLQRIFIGRP